MEDEDLSARERARIRARERKARPAKMVVDNAGVKRIQMALRNRAAAPKTASSAKAASKTRPAKLKRKKG
jgi:hypothetical protein